MKKLMIFAITLLLYIIKQQKKIIMTNTEAATALSAIATDVAAISAGVDTLLASGGNVSPEVETGITNIANAVTEVKNKLPQ